MIADSGYPNIPVTDTGKSACEHGSQWWRYFRGSWRCVICAYNLAEDRAERAETAIAAANIVAMDAGMRAEIAEARVRQLERAMLDYDPELNQLVSEAAGRVSEMQTRLITATDEAIAWRVLAEDRGAKLAELTEDIRRLNRERGITFFLIEHDMELIGRLCDHVVCMAEGRILVEGTAEVVKSDARVLDAYLGGGRAAA